ncbi:rod shape-determining protein MreD [Tumidithrix helvetica PCC 7403]|uniref:rod shape-determining protein MreD n=1 Tax=Tumidithrix helvetica TaxID=3457545 RepID=UPI003C7EE0F9
MPSQQNSWSPKLVGALVTFGSLALCILALPTRFPGMTLMDLSPNWLLIWLVAWSINRPVLLAVMTGTALGFLQDAMTIPSDVTIAPTHALGMAIAGGLTALLQKQRYMQEDFISIAFIVFGMAVVVETAIAVQLTLMGADVNKVWLLHQRIALGSAILSSLWSPVLHLPLSRWWRSQEKVED